TCRMISSTPRSKDPPAESGGWSRGAHTSGREVGPGTTRRSERASRQAVNHRGATASDAASHASAMTSETLIVLMSRASYRPRHGLESEGKAHATSKRAG